MYGIGFKMLANMGWDPTQGLGSDGQGIVTPAAVTMKNDKKGLVTAEELPNGQTTTRSEQSRASKRAAEKRRKKRRQLEAVMGLAPGSLAVHSDFNNPNYKPGNSKTRAKTKRKKRSRIEQNLGLQQGALAGIDVWGDQPEDLNCLHAHEKRLKLHTDTLVKIRRANVASAQHLAATTMCQTPTNPRFVTTTSQQFGKQPFGLKGHFNQQNPYFQNQKNQMLLNSQKSQFLQNSTFAQKGQKMPPLMGQFPPGTNKAVAPPASFYKQEREQMNKAVQQMRQRQVGQKQPQQTAQPPQAMTAMERYKAALAQSESAPQGPPPQQQQQPQRNYFSPTTNGGFGWASVSVNTPAVRQMNGSQMNGQHMNGQHMNGQHMNGQHMNGQHPGPQHSGPQHPGQQHPGPQHPGPQHPGPQHPGQQHPGPQHPGQQHFGPQHGQQHGQQQHYNNIANSYVPNGHLQPLSNINPPGSGPPQRQYF